MGFHTYDVARADALEDVSRYAYVSVDELLALFDGHARAEREASGADAGGDVIADLGSGTGFYTDDVAPYAGRLYAVDVQPAMHARYREKGVPSNVELVTAEAAALPFGDDVLDVACSTMTYHEFASEDALAELARVCCHGALVGVADWSREGEGLDGPPTDERYAFADARAAFEAAGFTVEYGRERRETFVLSARWDGRD